MAKSTSKLRVKAQQKKVDLTEYRIWWIEPEDFESIYDKYLMTAKGNAIQHDDALMPRFVYDEISDLMWDDKYKTVGLSIPDEYGFISRADWGKDMLLVGQNMLREGVVGDVGIFMHERDVTQFMHDNGFVTDHMVRGQEVVTQHSKDVQVVEKTKKPWNDRMAEFQEQVKDIIRPLVTPKVTVNINNYCIWWLNYGELMELVSALESYENGLDDNLDETLIRFVLTVQPYLEEALKDAVEEPDKEGSIIIPHQLPLSLEDWAEHGGVIELGKQGLGQRFGIVFEHLAPFPIAAEYGRVTYCNGQFLSDSALNLLVSDEHSSTMVGWALEVHDIERIVEAIETPVANRDLLDRTIIATVDNRLRNSIHIHYRHHPQDGGLWTVSKTITDKLVPKIGRVTDPMPDWEEEDPTEVNDALEVYAVWWLTQDQNKIINKGIRDGSINLPGYIADEVRRNEDCVTMGKVFIHETFPKEVAEILEENGSDEDVEINGIVINRIDAPNVEKYCGILTTLDMRTFEVESHMADELAIHKKPYTDDEMRELFLQHIRGLIDYWAQIHPKDGRQAASGIAHSVCSAIAGCSINLPGFIMVPHTTQEDAEWTMENGERPWPVTPSAIVQQLPDAGANLNEFLYQPPKEIPKCKLWLSQKEWFAGERSGRWGYIVEVLLKDTPFIKERYNVEHPGTVLANAYRDLCKLCLKHGAFFVPDEWDVLDGRYSFKWATDDTDVFEKMLKDLSGYTLLSHF